MEIGGGDENPSGYKRKRSHNEGAQPELPCRKGRKLAPSPFEDLPGELQVEILSYIAPSELHRAMPAVSKYFEGARTSRLSKTHQTLISTTEDLDSYLNGENSYKLRQLTISFFPNQEQLQKLAMYRELNVFMPAPIPIFDRNWLKTAKQLLHIPHFNLQFRDHLLYTWSLEDMKQLSESLGRESTNNLDIQKKMRASLFDFQFEVDLDHLQEIINKCPFLSQIKVINITPQIFICLSISWTQRGL